MGTSGGRSESGGASLTETWPVDDAGAACETRAVWVRLRAVQGQPFGDPPEDGRSGWYPGEKWYFFYPSHSALKLEASFHFIFYGLYSFF